MTVRLLTGDCRDIMAAMEPGSVDAIVTDPPYGLEFMGVAWDTMRDEGKPRTRNEWKDFGSREHARHPSEVARIHRNKSLALQEFSESWAREAYRVLKPGGHLLAFGGTRTFHRLTCALENAGFEIRDCLSWLYGSGFPKSLDVSKAMDKAAGAEREVAGDKLHRPGYHLHGHDGGQAFGHGLSSSTPETRLRSAQITVPATDLVRQWEGWGTALKPAWEPIVVARKPLDGTVAANVAAHGTGALNIDGCRIAGVMDGTWGARQASSIGYGGTEPQDYRTEQSALGRWPANVILDEDAAAVLDAQSGGRSFNRPATWRSDKQGDDGLIYASGVGDRKAGDARGGYGDRGGASRFFYCAKASRAERNAGLDGMPERASGVMQDDSYTWTHDGKGNAINLDTRSANHHPTVKPIALMRWLVKLITPPGGTVLDPFMGSGTTGIAAVLEGFDFIGIEESAEYVEIARRRIAHAQGPMFAAIETTL